MSGSEVLHDVQRDDLIDAARAAHVRAIFAEPEYNAQLAEEEQVEIVIQINGKVRDRVTASTTASQEELKALALAAPNVIAHTAGKEIVKVVVVAGKLVNIVVK